MANRRKKRTAAQETFGFMRRGGARKGAGRKPNGERALVSHATRTKLASRFPVHVTMKLRAGLPSLRRRRTRRVLLQAFGGGCERFGFRLVEYSIQSNHLHLIAEATNRRALARGAQGLAVRIAKGLNRAWGRKGKVFADRYHDRILRTPREVRNALAYVLRNGARHGSVGAGVDSFSSGPWFDGWREGRVARRAAVHLATARSWLLDVGWRRRGLLRWHEVPGGA